MAFRLDSGMAAALVDGSARSNADGTYSLFFFGTLVHPAILSKVIQNDGAHVAVQPAILPGYVVHHVANEDYPGLIAREQSDALINGRAVVGETVPVATAEAVRGTVARGLTAADVHKLDAFEGDEYLRIGVHVRADPSVPALANHKRPRDESIGKILAPLDADRIAHLVQTQPEEFANVYLWRAPVELLEPRAWDFAAFTQSGKDRKWYA